MATHPHADKAGDNPGATMDRLREQQESALPPGRQAGICLHVTSLPGRYGIGELGEEAHRFIDFLADAGAKVWQFLPLGPTAYGDSPYQPLSTFAGNELLIDIADLVELGLLQAEEVVPLEALPTETVDYGQLIPIKQCLLARAASRFDDKAPDWLQAEKQRFLDANNDAWLHDYALFRVLKTKHGERPWPEWDASLVHRETAALRRVEAEFAPEVAAAKTIQFLFADQWRRLREHAGKRGVYLFGDMPICIALDSADAWANRDMLRIDRDGQPDCVAGVPPDYFSADGQLWGNPLYAWDYHDAHGYDWWIQRLRHAATLANMVRIDHFRGFESYWSVPAHETTARNGQWEPGPGDRIFDAMRDALGYLPIVAEDLGVITPEVDSLRKRHHIPGMVVLQFDVADDNFQLSNIGENSVCYTGTHDNDTTVGWFRGSPDDTRSKDELERTRQRVLALTGGTEDTVHWDLLRLAAESPARLVIAPMQDCLGLGSEARLNTPGTSRNNWRWRVPAEALDSTFANRLRTLLNACGRG